MSKESAAQTGMRYIEVAKPAEITDLWQDPRTGEVSVRGQKLFSYFELMRDEVWSRNEWRKNELYANAFNRLIDAHDLAEQHGLPVIAMSQEDYVLFQPLATLSDRPIKGPNVKAINRLTQCVTFAASTKPKNFVELVAARDLVNGAGAELPAEKAADVSEAPAAT